MIYDFAKKIPEQYFHCEKPKRQKPCGFKSRINRNL